MRSVSVRELRGKSAQIWRELLSEQDMVIRSKGKPIAILSATTEDTLEESLKAFQRARATLALIRAQMDSVRKGKDKMSPEEINRLIAAVRKARRK
jgi:antitoxin (DNA-binding transcriptional repressor) of toxin-antitoxin stability system